jgi:hypothetical protein
MKKEKSKTCPIPSGDCPIRERGGVWGKTLWSFGLYGLKFLLERM